ncbi:MAG TPA: hypothetical protein VF183_05280 [Acidimicrobiales bacterium]
MSMPSRAASDVEPVIVTGVVERIENGIAEVLVGPERELWDFPLEILPDNVAVDSVLVLERRGRRLTFVDLDPVAEVARGRPFDVRLRRTARKVPYMRLACTDGVARDAQPVDQSDNSDADDAG